jgi:hypothetical protein
MASQSIEASRFPFGQPVEPSPASRSEPSEAFILGAYPSGLHIRWTPPSEFGKPIRALIVDNEPEPFWDGGGVEDLTEWRRAVGWQAHWGRADAAPQSNGPSGKWVNEHILAPLGLDRSRVCITDCLNTSRLNPNQAARIADTYAAFAARVGLPESTLPAVPSGETGIVTEATQGHVDRLRDELRACAPARIVTLGNAALRVLGHVVAIPKGLPRGISHDGYGTPIEVTFEDRPIELLPLVHPRNGERHREWSKTHAEWETTRQP